MTDRPEVPNDLYVTAVAIAREIGRQHGLRPDDHRIEDIAQSLFLVGWEDWRDTGNLGWAKHRMRPLNTYLASDPQARSVPDLYRNWPTAPSNEASTKHAIENNGV